MHTILEESVRIGNSLCQNKSATGKVKCKAVGMIKLNIISYVYA